jgi:hypothetical protein
MPNLFSLLDGLGKVLHFGIWVTALMARKWRTVGPNCAALCISRGFSDLAQHL